MCPFEYALNLPMPGTSAVSIICASGNPTSSGVVVFNACQLTVMSITVLQWFSIECHKQSGNYFVLAWFYHGLRLAE